MSDRLSGRVALVTGGAQGIGRAIADRLDAAGATVVVGDLRAVDSTRLDAVTLDVTDEGSIAAVVDTIEDRHGRLDIVVNNAGIMFEETLETQTLDQWDQMMAVNLRGPFLVTRAALPLLRERGGSVINIGSKGSPPTRAIPRTRHPRAACMASPSHSLSISVPMVCAVMRSPRVGSTRSSTRTTWIGTHAARKRSPRLPACIRSGTSALQATSATWRCGSRPTSLASSRGR